MKSTTLATAFAVMIGTVQGQPSLTLYNQNFATVRDQLALDLKEGTNDVRFTDTTAHVEPHSVILRDPAGKVALHVLEQNYRADPISAELLLSMNEGKTIDFFVPGADGKPDQLVKGKVIRSGYVAHSYFAQRRCGNNYAMAQVSMAYGNGGQSQPIIEVEGQLRFSLPGQPRFPALADDTVLKPTLEWKLHADQAAKLNAEISYVTGGMGWDAAYNVVSPEKGDTLSLTGWVTMDNQSGKTFTEAKIQLVAGDVAKVSDEEAERRRRAGMKVQYAVAGFDIGAPRVTEQSFDEYHLYTLPLPTTLHDRETKQVEFVQASGIPSERVYVYDGVKIDSQRYNGYNMRSIRQEEDYGTESNPKVWVLREFKNSKANQLGLPLPKGKVRFYRQDEAGRMQFTGENAIDHTATDETLRIYTGNAFDLVGERKRTNFKRDNNDHWLDETFEIKLRNHKKEAVDIRVVEHLYRWINWDIVEPSNTFLKTNAQTIEFRIPLKPDEERAISYTVHYTW